MAHNYETTIEFGGSDDIPPFPGMDAIKNFNIKDLPAKMPTMEELQGTATGNGYDPPPMVVFDIPEDASAMPLHEQSGTVVVGPGAEKEAQLLGLGLPKLNFHQHDDLAKAKKYAMEQSIKHVLMKQTVAHQANQQKVAMYAQALSLMGRVYIGSISFEVREETMKNAFSPFGPIKSINMSWDPVTGHHKGFAFLEYDVPEAALLAQEQMNGLLMGGRNLKVGRPSNMPQAQPIIESIMQEAKEYHRVYVASIHPDLSETDLKSVFEAFGVVKSCMLAKHSVQGASHRGYGYIEFDNPKSVQDAVASMNLFDLGGQYLRVGRAITPPQAQSYIVPTAAANMPTASAVAAAAITAKIQAMEAGSSSSPVSGIGLGMQPRVIPGNITTDLSDMQHAAVAAQEAGAAVFSVPPPGLAIPGGMSSLSRGGSPSDRNSPRGFGAKADAPVPPPAVLAITQTDEPMEQANNSVVPAAPPEPKREREKESSDAARKRKRRNKAKNAMKELMDPKNKPKVTADSLAAQDAAHKLVNQGALSDKMNKLKDSDKEVTLASQEDMQIRGGEARSVLMHKLMRSNESCVLVLRNMVGAEDVDEFLQEEVQEECSKYGQVDHVVIYKEQQGEAIDSPVIVKIFVRFSSATEVDKARSSLNGRYFAGRKLAADVYDQDLFEHNDLSM